tara:strand:- start:1329 stop:1505 length:177 start_codon:yes stop_codon:yes gene_type:complete
MEEIKKLICDTVNPWLKILPKENHEEFAQKFQVLINDMFKARLRQLAETLSDESEGRE